MGSTFLRRLKFYGIGFGLGLVFVFFFFKNRGCSWLPENRVKNTILDRVMVVSDETIEVLQQKGISKEVVIEALNQGDVLFSESDKNSDSKVYVVEYKGHRFLYTLPYESFVTEVKFGGDPNKTETSTSGLGTIWRLPADDNLVFIDSSAVLDCQMKQLKLSDAKAVFTKIKQSGKLDFGRTDFDIDPKPEHMIVFQVDSITVSAKTIWYKDKLEVLSFEFPSSENCP